MARPARAKSDAHVIRTFKELMHHIKFAGRDYGNFIGIVTKVVGPFTKIGSGWRTSIELGDGTIKDGAIMTTGVIRFWTNNNSEYPDSPLCPTVCPGDLLIVFGVGVQLAPSEDFLKIEFKGVNTRRALWVIPKDFVKQGVFLPSKEHEFDPRKIINENHREKIIRGVESAASRLMEGDRSAYMSLCDTGVSGIVVEVFTWKEVDEVMAVVIRAAGIETPFDKFIEPMILNAEGPTEIEKIKNQSQEPIIQLEMRNDIKFRKCNDLMGPSNAKDVLVVLSEDASRAEPTSHPVAPGMMLHLDKDCIDVRGKFLFYDMSWFSMLPFSDTNPKGSWIVDRFPILADSL